MAVLLFVLLLFDDELAEEKLGWLLIVDGFVAWISECEDWCCKRERIKLCGLFEVQLNHSPSSLSSYASLNRNCHPSPSGSDPSRTSARKAAPRLMLLVYIQVNADPNAMEHRNKCIRPDDSDVVPK